MKPITLLLRLTLTRRPRIVPEVTPESEEEKKLYEGALRRRQVRLILGGKMKPDDAVELKALFNPQPPEGETPNS